MSQVLALAQELIRCPSITPHDGGCQPLISQRLSRLTFQVEHMRFGEVDNLWARHGTQSPLFVFAGHTDVVPPGPLEAWASRPFQPTVRNGFLYGRGAADMKGGLAAMVIAAEEFLQHFPHYAGSIAFLLTSDEEGPNNLHGTQRVIEELHKRAIQIDYCIVGEASSETMLGDQIRVGRRGSLSGKLIIQGKQGHVAFPHLAHNPIHLLAPALQEMTSKNWDEGNEFFPATTFQISNIKAGTGARNVIPGTVELDFNFRFSTASTISSLQDSIVTLLEKYQLHFELQWECSAQPFITKKAKLLEAVQLAIKEQVGLETVLSTGGGTSDARFIAPMGAEVIELGPCNKSVHQIDEHVSITELDTLMSIYKKILVRLLTAP